MATKTTAALLDGLSLGLLSPCPTSSKTAISTGYGSDQKVKKTYSSKASCSSMRTCSLALRTAALAECNALSAADSADSASVTFWRAATMDGSCLKLLPLPDESDELERRRLKKPPERVELARIEPLLLEP